MIQKSTSICLNIRVVLFDISEPPLPWHSCCWPCASPLPLSLLTRSRVVPCPVPAPRRPPYEPAFSPPIVCSPFALPFLMTKSRRSNELNDSKACVAHSEPLSFLCSFVVVLFPPSRALLTHTPSHRFKDHVRDTNQSNINALETTQLAVHDTSLTMYATTTRKTMRKRKGRKIKVTSHS